MELSDSERLIVWRMEQIQELLDSAQRNVKPADHPAHAMINNMRDLARSAVDEIESERPVIGRED